MTDPLVLDAWPVMEWFRGRDPAGSAFGLLLSEAASGHRSLSISRINLGEVYYLTAKSYGPRTASTLVQQLTAVPIEVVTITDADIDAAARLKGRYSISYADGFAAVLSIHRHAALVTGDGDFLPLVSDGLLRLQWVGV